jgi:hypothetical protein
VVAPDLGRHEPIEARTEPDTLSQLPQITTHVFDRLIPRRRILGERAIDDVPECPRNPGIDLLPMLCASNSACQPSRPSWNK